MFFFYPCNIAGVYAFGFLFMLPQLFINYKLKSVAHLPWRAFMYKVCGNILRNVKCNAIHGAPVKVSQLADTDYGCVKLLETVVWSVQHCHCSSNLEFVKIARKLKFYA